MDTSAPLQKNRSLCYPVSGLSGYNLHCARHFIFIKHVAWTPYSVLLRMSCDTVWSPSSLSPESPRTVPAVPVPLTRSSSPQECAPRYKGHVHNDPVGGCLAAESGLQWVEVRRAPRASCPACPALQPSPRTAVIHTSSSPCAGFPPLTVPGLAHLGTSHAPSRSQREGPRPPLGPQVAACHLPSVLYSSARCHVLQI